MDTKENQQQIEPPSTPREANALIRLKDDNVRRTMPVCKAVFDPTTSRYAAGQSGLDMSYMV
jgi:hypothetical protein